MTSDNPTPVTDAELHAWVDGQLPPELAPVVSDWLLQHPDDVARVQAWQAQRLGLQALQRRVLDEPVPLALARATRPRRSRPWLQGLVASLMLGLGFAGGWWLRPVDAPLASASEPGFVQEARVAHAVYVPEKRHAVEVGAQEQAHLVQWLSRRLGTPLKAPLLEDQGFGLMGGRLLPGQAGEPRALFMYENPAAGRITLHVSVLEAGANPTPAAFRFTRVGQTETFYWVEGSLGYALSGDLPRERLAQLADAVYRQLKPEVLAP